MQLVTFIRDFNVNFRKSEGEQPFRFEAGRDYVISAHHWERLVAEPKVAAEFKRSSFFEPRLRQFRVDPHGGGGKSVLFHTGAGGYGDQLMMWPVVRWLAESAGYAVHVLADFKGNETCWWHFPWVKGVSSLPKPLDYFRGFDELCLFEQITNVDEHPGQLHPIDAVLHRMGIDPDLVPSEAKCVAPALSDGERAMARRFRAGRKVAFYQPSATSPTRTLPADLSVATLTALAKAFPGIHWFSIVDSFVPQGFWKKPDGASNVEIICFPSLRHLFAMAELAEVGVGPDSLLCHAMGVWGRPCVGLWGSTDPAYRVAYYKGHRPLRDPKVCPHAPCLVYRPQFPSYCPTRTSGWCGVLPRDPAQIVAAVKEILG
jgi:hypothetical protein